MTRRERLEARLERRRQWAASRAAKSDAAFNRARRIADGIPFGQPILVGHHSERHHRRDVARIDAGMSAGVESMKMAAHHTAKAGGLERALETSIFSDDPDALEALEARIAELEAQRAGRVAENKAARKAKQPAPWPAYSLTNLSGNIRRLRGRVDDVKRQQREQAECEAAGGVIVRAPGNGYAVVRFAEYPGRRIVEELKAGGFHWSGGAWHGREESIPASVLDEVEAAAQWAAERGLAEQRAETRAEERNERALLGGEYVDREEGR